MNLARQKTCKLLMQVHQKFVIHLAEPIWIRNRLEAFAGAPVFASLRRGESLWRNKLSYVIRV